MKLFISYSRDDSQWVFDLWRALQNDGHHDAWIDRKIVPATDWWATICENIRQADCFIYVMTPKSVESIYCQGELDYALALNKPVLPVMLKRCDFPAPLRKSRIQYQSLTPDMSMYQVLYKIGLGLTEVRVGLLEGKYPPRDVPMPDVPSPERKPEHIFEVFAMAEEAAADNITLAQEFFGQVIAADPNGLGAAARERMDEIAQERDRATAYANVKRLAENPVTLKGAKAAWRAFVRQYPGYDPDNLAATLANNPKPPRNPGTQPVGTAFSPSAPDPAPPTADDLTRRTLDILPPPFAWIEIPAGQVTLQKGGYVPEGGLTVDVPAFMIAKYPVTNSQFAKFIEADGYKNKDWWTDAGWQYCQEEGWTQPLYWTNNEWNGADYPVVGVSWFEALAFCNWLDDAVGMRNGASVALRGRITLPTEAQWQWAAQGDDRPKYPYGNTFDASRANTGGFGIGRTTPVTQYEGKGDSPFGVVDMSGNVWEWCLTDYGSGKDNVDLTDARRVLRGGAWFYFQVDARAVARNDSNPDFRSYVNGFRLVVVRP